MITEENKTQTFKIVNKAVTTAAVFNKNSFNHQFKNNNNFIIVYFKQSVKTLLCFLNVNFFF